MPLVKAKARLTDFGRDMTYQIGGLPIAVRGAMTRGTAAEAVIRRAYARRYWSPRSFAEFMRLVLAILTWPIALIGLEAFFLLRNGIAASKRSGRSVIAQLFDQIRFYLCSGLLPPWYYIFELHGAPRCEMVRSYIYRWESKGGVMRLLKEGERAPQSELTDKVAFADYCRRCGIATPPVLAVITPEQIEFREDPAALEHDLFVKPVTGRGGKGAQRWDYCGRGQYRSPAGEILAQSALLDRLQAHSNKAPLLIQPRLTNHEDLRVLNNGALSTVRMLSCLDEQGEPELVGAAARMAIGSNHVVDNLHSGGIATAVDLATGEMSEASNLGGDSSIGWVDRHPVSGAPIAGTRLPLWDETKALALEAHRAFRDRVLIGWDIAITPNGPVVVEGNGAPDLDIMQRFARQGMMVARLGVLLAFQLSQLDFDGLPFF